MNNLEQNETLLTQFDKLDLANAQEKVKANLAKLDDGELFAEICFNELFVYEDRNLKSSSKSFSQGFGLRGIIGETTAYSYSNNFTDKAIDKAIHNISFLQTESSKKDKYNIFNETQKNIMLYPNANPLAEKSFKDKIMFLSIVDDYMRSKCNLIKHITISLSLEWQYIEIWRPFDVNKIDHRPLVKIGINCILEENGKRESGSAGFGGRDKLENFISLEKWQSFADSAINQAKINLHAKAAPAGEMQVVLGAGWPGVLLHEAIGHGLEGDFNRKKSSAFHNLIGKQVASQGVTVIDDGTIPNMRGSLNFDDEGTRTQENILIQDGILMNYIQDRHNARLMGVKPTGNGRRESYAHMPLPRMTNTYMASGKDTSADLIKDIKNGIYAVNFGGGQVDITSGKFVFSTTEAYRIENGEITYPIKGATLIGDGPTALTHIVGVANDSKLDDGVGTCGKAGQSVPVCVGQPTISMSKLTVGGTGE